MARVRLSLSGVDGALRGEMTRRAQVALARYRKEPLRLDAPDYPFARHAADGSIRDPGSSSTQAIPGGIRIKVTSRGAPFYEEGNDAGGRFIEGGPNGLALPLRQTARARGRAHRDARSQQRKGGGKVVTGEDGRAYIMVQRVRSYRGRHVLEREVRRAFGLGGRIV